MKLRRLTDQLWVPSPPPDGNASRHQSVRCVSNCKSAENGSDTQRAHHRQLLAVTAPSRGTIPDITIPCVHASIGYAALAFRGIVGACDGARGMSGRWPGKRRMD